jgi:hypothetical protein
MTDDPLLSEHWRRFADVAREDLIPKVRESSSVMLIAPNAGNPLDIQFALEIGASILLDKPLVLMLPPGRTPPPKLAKVADKIIHADLSTEAGRIAAESDLKAILKGQG